MSDANVHRSTPGYVYGVAISSSGQEEGVPPCSCPCHVADTPRGAKGWWCDRCYTYTACLSHPPREPVSYSHEQAIADGTTHTRPYMVNVPDYYFITKGNTLSDELGEHFKSAEAADKRVKELNDADAISSLKIPRTHRKRFDRFRDLHGDHFGWAFYDGEHHPLTRLSRKPGQYAVETWGDGDTYWDTYKTLDAVREELLSGDVRRIVDLDTGEDVPFVLTATVGNEAAAMREP